VDTGAKLPRSAGFVGGCARPRSHSGRDESDDDDDDDDDVDGPVAAALRISIVSAILCGFAPLRDAHE
jgi:hypothetical protein